MALLCWSDRNKSRMHSISRMHHLDCCLISSENSPNLTLFDILMKSLNLASRVPCFLKYVYAEIFLQMITNHVLIKVANSSVIIWVPQAMCFRNWRIAIVRNKCWFSCLNKLSLKISE